MNIQKMMKQAQNMQKRMGELQEEMEKREVEGVAGGGVVRVLLTGKSVMLKVSIDDSLMEKSEKEMLEDLIVAAYNDAKNKIDSSFNEEVGKITGGMGLPGDFKLPF